MVLAKTDNTIVSIRGRFGGVYFKIGSDGQHIQAMPRHVNYQRSPAQVHGSGISGFSSCAWIWQLALLGFFAAAWAAYALVFFFTTKTGERKKITGYNWYIYYGMMFPEEWGTQFWKPPHSPGELPQCIVTYQGMWTYEHSPLEWPVWAPTDYYWFGGWFGEYPYFITDNKKWFLWRKETCWVLTTNLGVEDPETTFYSDGVNIFDYYRNPVKKKWAHVYIGGGEFPD